MSVLSVNIRLKRPGFELEVEHRFAADGITAVFGRSGAGKSSLLRAIAGLEDGVSGTVTFGDEIWQDAADVVPAHQRGAGLVFQSARLFDQLNVRGNLSYAARRAPGGPEQAGLDDLAGAMGITHLLDRHPATLSGGESQRVAMARCLLSRPRLLLLDEPLASLDQGAKADILPLIADLPGRFGLPVLYVTHSLEEVTRLADHMVVLEQGRVIAAGSVADCLDRAEILPATGRFEASALLEGRVEAVDLALQITTVSVGDVHLETPGTTIPPGADVRMRIRARDVSLALTEPKGLSIRNAIPGTITAIYEEPDTAFAEVTVDIGAGSVRARITRASLNDLGLTEAKPVYALIKSVSFDRRLLAGGTKGTTPDR